MNENQRYTSFASEEQEEEINIRQIIEQYAYYWKYILASIVLALLVAFAYLRYTTPLYNVQAQILLNEKGGTSPELSVLADAASSFMGASTNAVVGDQIKVLKSRRLISKVIAEHQLNTTYSIQGNFRNSDLLAKDSPVSIEYKNPMMKYSDSLKGTLLIETVDSQKFTIKESTFVPKGTYAYNQTIKSSLGDVVLFAHPKVSKPGTLVEICTISVNNAIQAWQKKIQINSDADKKSMAVLFQVTENNTERGKLFINHLIEAYNNDVQTDNQKLAKATTEFINNRLNIISNDLEGVDKNMEQFKSSNKITNAEAEANLFLNNAFSIDKEVTTFSAQLDIARHLTNTLSQNKSVLLPSNIGIQDAALSTAINNYNTLVLEKQELSKSMKDNNPSMATLNQNILDSKENIKSSVQLYERNLQMQLQTVESKRGESTSKLAQLPKQESGLRKIARQQQIVESIYLYLLEKREEAEIKSSASVDVIKIIDLAYADQVPVAPKKQIILLGAFLLGCILPLGIIFVYFKLNNTVKDKKEIGEIFSGAILGEVPKSENTMITFDDRSSLAESFRIIRSNLSFVLPKHDKGKVIYITSTLSGEGKTFTAVNLLKILSLTQKKTLLIGADVRSPKILSYLGLHEGGAHPKGLTDLLADDLLKTDEVLWKQPANYLFDVLPAGTIPPNPSELLMNHRYEQLIQEMKEIYDYIIVDTAPVGMVGDTQIIAEHADATLYVIRANYLDRRMLPIFKDMFTQKKLKNMAVIVNDVDHNKGYGYGYGYGYGNDQPNKKKGFFSFLSK